MNGPSPHLAWSELACRDGSTYPVEWRETRARQLADAFELIRRESGNRPITVLSAYRTPSYNKRIGGAPRSQHCEGRALDLRPPKHLSLDAFYRLIRKHARAAGIRGIGLYATFIHIDVRPGEHLALWGRPAPA